MTGNGTPRTLRGEVDKRLADAAAPYPWLARMFDGGDVPSVAELQQVGLDGVVWASLKMLAATIDCVSALATEMDRHIASSRGKDS
jgi:hypothetical protein